MDSDTSASNLNPVYPEGLTGTSEVGLLSVVGYSNLFLCLFGESDCNLVYCQLTLVHYVRLFLTGRVKRI